MPDARSYSRIAPSRQPTASSRLSGARARPKTASRSPWSCSGTPSSRWVCRLHSRTVPSWLAEISRCMSAVIASPEIGPLWISSRAFSFAPATSHSTTGNLPACANCAPVASVAPSAEKTSTRVLWLSVGILTVGWRVVRSHSLISPPGSFLPFTGSGGDAVASTPPLGANARAVTGALTGSIATGAGAADLNGTVYRSTLGPLTTASRFVSGAKAMMVPGTVASSRPVEVRYTVTL